MDRDRNAAANDLNQIAADSVNMLPARISGACNPGAQVTFTVTNPIDGSQRSLTGIAQTSLSPGDGITAIRSDDGRWWLRSDRAPQDTNRQPVTQARHAQPQPPEDLGRIKGLYTVTTATEVQFWIGGHQPKPVQIYSVPIGAEAEAEFEFDAAWLSNLGRGWNLDLRLRQKATNLFQYRQIRNGKLLYDVRHEEINLLGPVPSLNPLGHGFWTGGVFSSDTGFQPIDGGFQRTQTGQHYALWKGEFTQTNLEIVEIIETATQQRHYYQNFAMPILPGVTADFLIDTVYFAPGGGGDTIVTSAVSTPAPIRIDATGKAGVYNLNQRQIIGDITVESFDKTVFRVGGHEATVVAPNEAAIDFGYIVDVTADRLAVMALENPNNPAANKKATMKIFDRNLNKVSERKTKIYPFPLPAASDGWINFSYA